jgi:flagellar protein FliS
MYPPNARRRFVTDGISVVPGGRLLIMLYERLMRDLDDASAAIASGSVPAAHEALTHGQAIVDELRYALDPAVWDGAHQLGEIYGWLSAQLLDANLRKDAEAVAACRPVVLSLLETWTEAYERRDGLATPGADPSDEGPSDAVPATRVSTAA